MRSVAIPVFCLLALIATSSCKKKVTKTDREKQEEQEVTQPLLSNQILEQEGVRFTLSYTPSEAEIGLKLFTPETGARTELPLRALQPNVVYTVTAGELAENSVSVLEVDFKRITANGTFNITVAGFTDINANKNFMITAIPFQTTNQGTTRKILKISKGIRKISFEGY